MAGALFRPAPAGCIAAGLRSQIFPYRNPLGNATASASRFAISKQTLESYKILAPLLNGTLQYDLQVSSSKRGKNLSSPEIASSCVSVFWVS